MVRRRFDSAQVHTKIPFYMEILPRQYVDIRIENTTTINEVAIFGEIVRKCYTIAQKPGLNNTFTNPEKELIARIANDLGIEREETLYE